MKIILQPRRDSITRCNPDHYAGSYDASLRKDQIAQVGADMRDKSIDTLGLSSNAISVEANQRLIDHQWVLRIENITIPWIRFLFQGMISFPKLIFNTAMTPLISFFNLTKQSIKNVRDYFSTIGNWVGNHILAQGKRISQQLERVKDACYSGLNRIFFQPFRALLQPFIQVGTGLKNGYHKLATTIVEGWSQLKSNLRIVSSRLKKIKNRSNNFFETASQNMRKVITRIQEFNLQSFIPSVQFLKARESIFAWKVKVTHQVKDAKQFADRVTDSLKGGFDKAMLLLRVPFNRINSYGIPLFQKVVAALQGKRENYRNRWIPIKKRFLSALSGYHERLQNMQYRDNLEKFFNSSFFLHLSEKTRVSIKNKLESSLALLIMNFLLRLYKAIMGWILRLPSSFFKFSDTVKSIFINNGDFFSHGLMLGKGAFVKGRNQLGKTFQVFQKLGFFLIWNCLVAGFMTATLFYWVLSRIWQEGKYAFRTQN